VNCSKWVGSKLQRQHKLTSCWGWFCALGLPLPIISRLIITWKEPALWVVAVSPCPKLQRKSPSDHANSSVSSTSCAKEVLNKSPMPPMPCTACTAILQSCGFRNIVNKEIPFEENFKHINHCFCNSKLGKIYTQILGVKELIEDDLDEAHYSKINCSICFELIIITLVRRHTQAPLYTMH